MKIITLTALLTVGLAASAHAQTTTSSQAGAGAVATVNQVNVVPGSGGGGGGGVGYLNTNVTGTQWILGGTPSMNTTQYDACTKYITGSAILGGLSIPLEIDMCWKMRQMDAMAKYPPGSVQYNLGCADSDWLKNDWETGTMACVANKAKLAKANPNDPRSVNTQAVPVVAVTGPGVPGRSVPNAPPPNGVNIPAPNAQPSMSQVVPGPTTLPRCKGPTDQSRCFSG